MLTRVDETEAAKLKAAALALADAAAHHHTQQPPPITHHALAHTHADRDYLLASSTDDAPRHLLLAIDERAFLVGSTSVWRLPDLRLPGADALLDGALRSAADGSLTFSVADACCVGGDSLVHEPLPLRLMRAFRLVVRPYSLHPSSAHFALELESHYAPAQLLAGAPPLPGAAGALVSAASVDASPRDDALPRMSLVLRSNAAPATSLESRSTWRPWSEPRVFGVGVVWRPVSATETSTLYPRLQLLAAADAAVPVAESLGWVPYTWVEPWPEVETVLARTSPPAQASSLALLEELLVECVWSESAECRAYDPVDRRCASWEHAVRRRGTWRAVRARDGDVARPSTLAEVRAAEEAVRCMARPVQLRSFFDVAAHSGFGCGVPGCFFCRAPQGCGVVNCAVPSG